MTAPHIKVLMASAFVQLAIERRRMKMQGFKVVGDVKDVVLALKAIRAYYKTIEAFMSATKDYTPLRRNHLCKVAVAFYQMQGGV